MYCDNEIRKEELDNIYRIEYMPTSNWTMGDPRTIWVVEFSDITSDDYPKRSVYFGRPLVPEYRLYGDNKDSIVMIADGKSVIFNNRFHSYHYSDVLERLEVWNWKNHEDNGIRITDGSNFDIAFFTKDSEGKDKICRYQEFETSFAEELCNIFDTFFETMDISEVEYVRGNSEMMAKSAALLPGNNTDSSEEARPLPSTSIIFFPKSEDGSNLSDEPAIEILTLDPEFRIRKNVHLGNLEKTGYGYQVYIENKDQIELMNRYLMQRGHRSVLILHGDYAHVFNLELRRDVNSSYGTVTYFAEKGLKDSHIGYSIHLEDSEILDKDLFFTDDFSRTLEKHPDLLKIKQPAEME